MSEVDDALDPHVIATLRQLTGPGEPDVVVEVMRLFRASARSRLDAIHVACLAGDAAALRRSAHEFKGASATIGAAGLAHHCRELENIAASGSLASWRELIDALDAEYVRVERAIAELVQ